jgi:hypothetical protein
MIDTHTSPPVGWPDLRVEIVDDAYADKGIDKYCGKSTFLFYRMACVAVDFINGVCYIFTRTRDKWVIEHEEAHCKGYGHLGGDPLPGMAMEYWKLKGWKPNG